MDLSQEDDAVCSGRDETAASHCWHGYYPNGGIDSFSLGADGFGSSVNHLRCCHCGKRRKVEQKWGPTAPVKHGRFA